MNNELRDKKKEGMDREFFQNLFFRRQFLLGSTPFKLNRQWKTLNLKHGLILSTHPDLEIHAEVRDKSSVALIGTVVDSLSPHKLASDIVISLIDNSSHVRDVINLTYSFAGRWLVIFQDTTGTYLFTDPCSFRQVFYHSNDQGVWCGSQPEIIKAVNTLTRRTDEELLRFLMSQNHARNESSWVGNRTIYAQCYHLMPNHYLDMNRGEQVRFFPADIQRTEKTSSIVESAASILQGTFQAVTRRGGIIQSLTAGWDSRVLLAASRHFSKNIEYFVDRMGVLPENHPDVWVTKRLAHKLSINFMIKNSTDEPPGWFVSMLAHNVTGARILPKSRTIFSHYVTGETRININGNGSEICRNFFDKYCRIEDNEVDITDMARLLGYNDITFVEHEIEKWKNDLNFEGSHDMNVLDMLYWEQRLGNWGAQYPAEQDIAIDEFSPFNCRLLIETLLAAPRHLRSAPGYSLYRGLIQAMWPDALSVPINPGVRVPIIRLTKKLLKPYIPTPILEFFRKKTR